MSKTAADDSPGVFGRRLLRRRNRAALATSLLGTPFASLILVVADLDASPLMLLSDLAQHSRNIAFDPRVSLLLDDTHGHPDPLTGPRLTLIGRAEAVDDALRLARFTAHHPTSEVYSRFGDFHLYRVTAERGHLVAGFGRIHWIEGQELRFRADTGSLAAAEPGILRHMNDDNPGAITNFAQRLLGRAGIGWRMTGIDPEGIDLRADEETARLDFAAPVLTREAAHAALAELAN